MFPPPSVLYICRLSPFPPATSGLSSVAITPSTSPALAAVTLGSAHAGPARTLRVELLGPVERRNPGIGARSVAVTHEVSGRRRVVDLPRVRVITELLDPRVGVRPVGAAVPGVVAALPRRRVAHAGVVRHLMHEVVRSEPWVVHVVAAVGIVVANRCDPKSASPPWRVGKPSSRTRRGASRRGPAPAPEAAGRPRGRCTRAGASPSCS